MAESETGMVGFDLHGLVSIGLVDASPADVRAVTRQLGPIRARLAGESQLPPRKTRLPAPSFTHALPSFGVPS